MWSQTFSKIILVIKYLSQSFSHKFLVAIFFFTSVTTVTIVTTVTNMTTVTTVTTDGRIDGPTDRQTDRQTDTQTFIFLELLRAAKNYTYLLV